MMKSERALLISRNFPPLVGGMERLMAEVQGRLSPDFVCDLIGPKGCAVAPPAISIGCGHRPIPRYLAAALGASTGAILRRRYHLVLAGSGLTAPVARLIAGAARASLVGFVHGLDLVVEDPLYQRLFVPALTHFDRVIANSRNTARLAMERGVKEERIRVLHPGVALPETIPDPAPFRERYALGQRPLMLSVGRIVPRKGMIEFVEEALPRVIERVPEALLLIVGGSAADAARRDEQTLARLVGLIEARKLTEHVRLLGRLDDPQLFQAYAAASLHLFPVRPVAGDVEGFGMVAIEAAAHGTPTIAFAEGGVVDAVDPGRSGLLIEPGDYAAFAAATVALLQNRLPELNSERCRAHARCHDWEQFGRQLRELLREARS